MAIPNCTFRPAFQNHRKFAVGNEHASLGADGHKYTRPVVVPLQKSNKTMTDFIDLPLFPCTIMSLTFPTSRGQKGSRRKPPQYR